MNKSLLFTILFFFNLFSLSAQVDNDDNLNGGPAQASIDEGIPLLVLLAIALVFFICTKKIK